MRAEEMNGKATGVSYPKDAAIGFKCIIINNRVKRNWETWNRLDSKIEKQLCLYFAVPESRI